MKHRNLSRALARCRLSDATKTYARKLAELWTRERSEAEWVRELISFEVAHEATRAERRASLRLIKGEGFEGETGERGAILRLIKG